MQFVTYTGSISEISIVSAPHIPLSIGWMTSKQRSQMEGDMSSGACVAQKPTLDSSWLFYSAFVCTQGEKMLKDLCQTGKREYDEQLPAGSLPQDRESPTRYRFRKETTLRQFLLSFSFLGGSQDVLPRPGSYCK